MSAADFYFPILEDGSIAKSLVECGTGDCPKFGMRVCIACSMDSEDDTTFFNSESMDFVLGQEHIPGLSTAVASMQVGEHSKFVLDPKWAWGDRGNEDVGPNETVKLDLRLISIQHEFSTKSDAEKSAESEIDEAALLFRDGQFDAAIARYRIALRYLSPFYGSDIDTITTRIYRNLSVAYAKVMRWHDSIHTADRVLQKEPHDLRALARKADGLLQIRNIQLAENVIRQGMKLSNDHQMFVSLGARLEALKKEERQRENELVRKMMS